MKPLKGKAEELFKTFTTTVNGVVADLKAANPELFSGDTKKLQVINLRLLPLKIPYFHDFFFSYFV